MNRTELERLLTRYNIPYKLWGKGGSKTIKHLLEELTTGETGFIIDDGLLLRRIRPIAFTVFATIGGKRMRLVEKSRIFADGRDASRHLSTTGGEKLLPTERFPILGARRALMEELGLPDLREHLILTGLEVRHGRRSSAYPGLLTRDRLVMYEVTLPPELVRIDGYTEIQPGPLGKTSSFVWEPVF